MIRIIYTILILASTCYGTSDNVILSGDKRALECGEVFLTHMLPIVAEGRIEGVLGSYQFLVPTLTAAGMLPENASLVFGYLDRFIQSSKSPIVQDLKRVLEKSDLDETRMIICALKEGCHLKEDQHSRHIMAQLGPFEIRWSQNSKDHYNTGRRDPPKIRTYQAIVLNSLPSDPNWVFSQAQKFVWLSRLAMHMTHFTTFDMIEQWLSANRRRLDQKLEPDTLFRRYVDNRGVKPIVDEGFVRLLTISRAEQLGLWFLGFLMPMKPPDTGTSRTESMKYLSEYGRISKSIIKKYGIGPHNIYEVGNALSEQMRKTIADTPG